MALACRAEAINQNSNNRAIYDDEDIALNPYDAIVDYYKFDAEQSSHLDGPEHTIISVNEIVRESGQGAEYDSLAMAGIYLSSGREFTNFNSLSAYFTKGIVAKDLTGSGAGNRSINTLPEIAYDL